MKYFFIAKKVRLNRFFLKVEINDNLPQIICPECWPQVITACKIKQTCLSSDKILRRAVKDEELENEDFFAVKIESEPDIFHVDTISNKVKEEPIDDYDSFVIDAPADYLRFDDPMRSVRRYSEELEPEYMPERERKRLKTLSSSSKTKREPPPSTFKCYLCNASFHQRKLKYEHLEKVHGRDKFKCRVCSHKSQTVKGHDNHLMLHENPDLLSHMCHICSKNYQKACELRRHIKLSHSDKSKRVSKFFCDCCDFKTFSKMNVKRHLRTIHLKIKAFQCQFCPDKKYTSKVTTIVTATR